MNNTLTNEQIAAYTAFGLLVRDHAAEMIEFIPVDELKQLAFEVDQKISPMVNDDTDMVTPILQIMKSTVAQLKAKG